MTNVDSVLTNMTRSVRARAEAYAKSQGLTLEEAVSQQLDSQLEEADLMSAIGGREQNEFNIECANGTELNIETSAGTATHPRCDQVGTIDKTQVSLG